MLKPAHVKTKKQCNKTPPRGAITIMRRVKRIVYNNKLKRIGFFLLRISVEKGVYNVVILDFLTTS